MFTLCTPDIKINGFHEQNFAQFLNKCSYVVNLIYKMCHLNEINSNLQVYIHKNETTAVFSLIRASAMD